MNGAQRKIIEHESEMRLCHFGISADYSTVINCIPDSRMMLFLPPLLLPPSPSLIYTRHARTRDRGESTHSSTVHRCVSPPREGNPRRTRPLRTGRTKPLLTRYLSPLLLGTLLILLRSCGAIPSDWSSRLKSPALPRHPLFHVLRSIKFLSHGRFAPVREHCKKNV